MSITIDGIPETITRSQYLGLMTAVGLDVKKLTMLEFRMDGIYATVKASDENGRDIIDYGRNEVVKHHVFIRVVDDLPTDVGAECGLDTSCPEPSRPAANPTAPTS